MNQFVTINFLLFSISVTFGIETLNLRFIWDTTSKTRVQWSEQCKLQFGNDWVLATVNTSILTQLQFLKNSLASQQVADHESSECLIGLKNGQWDDGETKYNPLQFFGITKVCFK